MSWRDQIAKVIEGIKAYHSSPHDFEKFDLSKIGSGEGAQVYGHGIYAAENPKVSGQGGEYWNNFMSRFPPHEQAAADRLKAAGFDREKAIAESQWNLDDLKKYVAQPDFAAQMRGGGLSAYDKQYYQQLIAQRQLEHDVLTSGNPVGPRTYELNIKADPSQFLNWDQPLSTQPQATEALIDAFKVPARQRRHIEQWQSPAWALNPGESPKSYLETIKGGTEYGALASDLGGFDAASAALRERGIPGIRYLDAGSRNAQPVLQTTPHGDVISSSYPPPTSNYVVFDPANIDILKKYGVVGAPAGAATMGALADQSSYQDPDPMQGTYNAR